MGLSPSDVDSAAWREVCNLTVELSEKGCCLLKRVPRCVFMQLVSPQNLTFSINSVTEGFATL